MQIITKLQNLGSFALFPGRKTINDVFDLPTVSVVRPDITMTQQVHPITEIIHNSSLLHITSLPLLWPRKMVP